MSSDATRVTDAARLPLTAAVLAGGRSRRMGTDKRALQVGGKSMLSRVVDTALSVCDQAIVVVAQDDDRLHDGWLGQRVTVVRDLIPRIGPVGGIMTALDAADTTWVLAVAADMPFLKPDAIRLLWERRGERGAVAFWGDRGFEPLLALYHAECLAVVRSMLTERRASPRSVLERVETVAVPIGSLREVDPRLGSLINVNTPHDYSQIVRDELRVQRGLLDLPGDLMRSATAEEAFSA